MDDGTCFEISKIFIRLDISCFVLVKVCLTFSRVWNIIVYSFLNFTKILRLPCPQQSNVAGDQVKILWHKTSADNNIAGRDKEQIQKEQIQSLQQITRVSTYFAKDSCILYPVSLYWSIQFYQRLDLYIYPLLLTFLALKNEKPKGVRLRVTKVYCSKFSGISSFHCIDVIRIYCTLKVIFH